MGKCIKSVTPTVNEDFNPTDFIYTHSVREYNSDDETFYTQEELNKIFKGEIKSLKRMLSLIEKKLEGYEEV